MICCHCCVDVLLRIAGIPCTALAHHAIIQGGHFAAMEKPKELMQDQEEFIASLNWGE